MRLHLSTWRPEGLALVERKDEVAEKAVRAVGRQARVERKALGRVGRVGGDASEPEWACYCITGVCKRLALCDGRALANVIADALLRGVEDYHALRVHGADGDVAGVGEDTRRVLLALVDALVNGRLGAALFRDRESEQEGGGGGDGARHVNHCCVASIASICRT